MMFVSDKKGCLVRTVCNYSMTAHCVNARLRQVRKKPSLTFLSLLGDLLLGWMVFSFSQSYVGPGSLSDSVFLGMETIVNHLKTLIIWMMENPGGLKLNSVLSRALGNFFLYHIHLWMTYVMLVVPLLTPRVSTLVSLLSMSSLSLQLLVRGSPLGLHREDELSQVFILNVLQQAGRLVLDIRLPLATRARGAGPTRCHRAGHRE